MRDLTSSSPGAAAPACARHAAVPYVAGRRCRTAAPLLLQGQQCPNPVLRPRMGTEQIVDPAHPQGVDDEHVRRGRVVLGRGHDPPGRHLLDALRRAPPGAIDDRSWRFWHRRSGVSGGRRAPRPEASAPTSRRSRAACSWQRQGQNRAASRHIDASAHHGVLPIASHFSSAAAMRAFGSAAVLSRPSLLKWRYSRPSTITQASGSIGAKLPRPTPPVQ